MIAALLLAAAGALPPVPTDYVTDKAQVLRSSTVSSVRSELRSYYDATGNRILVYIDRTTGGEPLEEWTVDAAEHWKIHAGRSRTGIDNAAVLFLFTQDRKVRIEVGYGLEPRLTDADSSRIIRELIVPKMRAGDPDAAVADGADAIVHTITPSFAAPGGAPAAQSEQNSASDDAAFEAIGIVLVVIALLVVLTLSRRRGPRSMWYWGGGYGGLGTPGGWSSGGGGGFSGGIGGGFSGAGFGGGGASGSW